MINLVPKIKSLGGGIFYCCKTILKAGAKNEKFT
ncbi:hypothetical protein FORC085_2577 [Bacillus cereus]|nr:putative permease [Bacillus cereus]QBZ25636.1 hypothetical protein FORC085_2577 [Bacillus cereus]